MNDISQAKYQRQIALEEAVREAAYSKGAGVLNNAMESGRFSDLPAGRRLVAAAFQESVTDLEATLKGKGSGLYGKYKTMLRRVPAETLVAMGLRQLLNAAIAPERGSGRFQNVIGELGKAIESEAVICAVEKAAPVYIERTLQYLDGGHTTSVNHRYRTFLAAAEATMVEWEPWTPAERQGTAKLLTQVLYETGLFHWEADSHDRGQLHINPSEALSQVIRDLQDQIVPLVRHEPMIVPPEPWTSFHAGGYLTPWLRANAKMVSMKGHTKEDRDWVAENLRPDSIAVRAMNKAQATAYRVNRGALSLLQRAIVIPEGCLGLPPHGEADKPAFPLPEGWQRDSASAEEMETFQLWKRSMSDWYAADSQRTATKRGVALALSTLLKFKEEAELYFVTYLDYRGRVYFRGNVHPQTSDAVKGCLEFAHGQVLGEEGLFWLKVHVANCAGFDKKDFHLRAKWTDENWPAISAWLQDPLASEPPEPDTAFTFYAAASALAAALAMPHPEEYVCHIPVAMDATCSGLQHLSAMFRDPVGSEYTNLFDSGGDEKRDIYMRVAEVASSRVRFEDPNVGAFWQGRQITRGMAKRPVMTFCYGSTLKSCIDYVCTGLLEEGAQPIMDGGKMLYSLHKLAVPVAKALRTGVTGTVPAAAAAMGYFQQLVRKSTTPLRWVTPTGMPVVNYVEGVQDKLVHIRSMGITSVVFRRPDGKYNTGKATAAISPNIVHSMDASHLCMTVVASSFDICPIHDSFAALPNKVSEMHRVLREQFVELYHHDVTAQFLELPVRKEEERPVRPSTGTFDIREVLTSRFIFC